MRPAFTLIELLVVVVLVGILASIGTRSISEMTERARVARAIQEIRGLEAAILYHQASSHTLPTSLDEAGVGGRTDPWGNSYVYMPLHSTGPSGKTKKDIGSARKDRFLVPLNSDFDLYSKGRDGDTKGPLNAPVSRDDVLRANDGGYVGLAETY